MSLSSSTIVPVLSPQYQSDVGVCLGGEVNFVLFDILKLMSGPLRGVDFMDVIGFIEIQRMLGVGKFIIYVLDQTEEIKKILDFYRDNFNIVIVLPWECPFSSREIRLLRALVHSQTNLKSQCRYFCQNLLLNDCLHRSRSMFQFTVFLDVDEAVIPALHENLHQLLLDLTQLHPDVASFGFSNRFHFRHWE